MPFIPDSKPTPDHGADTAVLLEHEPFYQVVLHNDDHNTMEWVIECLWRVFGHSEALAVKIMLEAHRCGRAIAEVEAESDARKHTDQLIAAGLSVTLEKL